MLAAWTWNQLAHEGGTFTAAMVAILCLIYLAGKGVSVIRTRECELLDRGIATGLMRKGAHALKSRRRFSLLDLLVAITFVAALAGLIRGMANTERDGIPWDRGLGDEYEEIRQRGE
jgi:hypothetical protein